MIKKFVSNALLSMVMDKNAREKLERRRQGSAGTGKGSGKAAPEAEQPARQAESVAAPADDDDVVETIAAALAEARSTLENGAAASGSTGRRRTGGGPLRDREGKPPTSEREALIRQALEIQSSKAQMLDNLDRESREKLEFMARYALDPDSLPLDAADRPGRAQRPAAAAPKPAGRRRK